MALADPPDFEDLRASVAADQAALGAPVADGMSRASPSGSSFARRTSAPGPAGCPSSPSARWRPGIDHLTVGDHVSFADGHGADGLIQAAALLSADPRVSVQTGVYLLALRHPAVVARQLATIALLAPGRFTFGVGVGGDDPAELELCGIDPRQRGARTTRRCDACAVDVGRAGRLPRAGSSSSRSDPPAPASRSRSSSVAARTRRSHAPGNSGTAGWRCGSRRDGSRRRSAASKPSPPRLGEAASAGSTRFSSGRASAPRARGRARG